MDGPSLAEIAVFETAVRRGSLSAAAREMGVSQQAVSARLRALERLIDIELVRRSPTGVVPTPAGEVVLAWSKELLTASERLGEAIASLRGTAERGLSVGASQTIASHLLPGWLLELRNRQLSGGHEASTVTLQTANSTAVIAMVRTGELDLGFIECPDLPRDLGVSVVRRDRMIVAVSPEHPWAGRAAIPLAELATVPLVSREEGSGTRAAFERAVHDELGGIPATPEVALATEAAVRSAVAHGVGPAVLSELTVEDDVRLGRIRALPIAPRPVLRPLTAIWRGARRELIGARRELVAISRGHRGGR